jgi:hypothetical protein
VSLVGEDVQLGDEDEGVHKGGVDGLDDVVAAEPKIDCAITVYETKTETIRVDPVTQTVTVVAAPVTVVAAPVTVTTSNSILIWMTTTPTTTQTTTTTLPVSTLVTTATVTETHTAVWTTTSTATTTTTDTQFWAVPTQNNYGGDDWRRGE